jgi:hypothetical protein
MHCLPLGFGRVVAHDAARRQDIFCLTAHDPGAPVSDNLPPPLTGEVAYDRLALIVVQRTQEAP